MKLHCGIIVWLGFVLSNSIIFGSSDDSSSSSSDASSCGVYLAQSTIPNAGLGMFAGKDYSIDDQVTDGDLMIPISEIEWHNGNDDNWIFLWDNYVWTGEGFVGMASNEEVEGSHISVASTGIGAAPNCLLSMENIEGTNNKVDSAGLHRSRDPGTGAITPFHDRKGFANENIVAGEELFISYGESYFHSRTPTYGLIPLLDDFDRADVLLETFATILPVETTPMTLRQDALNLILNFSFPSRTINAFPKNASDIEYVVQVGTGKQYNTIREISWLEKHGKCADNIRPGQSTIPGVGRGAFATRFIPKGGLVAPAPLIHITNMTRLVMYGVQEGNTSRNISNPVHQQLLVNYCFGHANSSLLLSPYGMFTGFINHSSKKPNVRIQWSDISTEQDWCDLTLEELSTKNHAGFVFDYIALEDIQEGQEILLDYGREWEEAWEKHVRNWKPPKNADKYTPAYELESDVDSTIRTIHEEPYSDNVLLYLYEEYRLMNGLSKSPPDYREWHQARILDRYQDWKNETVYMVEIFHEMEDYEQDMTLIEYDSEILFAVPRDAFLFQDVPYSRDHYLYTSFRHPMMIPDDMFPERWMNLRQRTK